jgi:hypothetical protein
VDDTWSTRDLLVLDAVVRYLDERPGSPFPGTFTDSLVTFGDIMASNPDLAPDQILRAARVLDGEYLEISWVDGSAPEPNAIIGVTPLARRAVGQWPSPESLLRVLIKELEDAADQEDDSTAKKNLKKAAAFLATSGWTVGLNVAARALGMGVGV